MEALFLVCRLTHPADGEPLCLVGRVDGYKAMPPAWDFVDPQTQEPDPRAFPSGGNVPGGGSIFHNSRVICAPFNRLAFGDYGGPHGKWSTEGWLEIRGNVRAATLAEMLNVIATHLRFSPGRMA